ncbi:MAG: hypothetical protein ABSF38_00740 [Verrucomicrobiota bacterium]
MTKTRLFSLVPIRALAGGCCLWLACSCCQAQTSPYSIGHADSQGFDVAIGGLHVTNTLAANGALVADSVVSNACGVTLSLLRAADSNAVVFDTNDFVTLSLPADPTLPPVISFQLTFVSFDQAKWIALFPTNQPAPFHFLVCSMPTAQVWHQRGWLNATPVADPFPLLLDPHDGTPEISCLWNRNWSYICPLAGHPIPMIGLWDPSLGLYYGYDFQASRATWAQSESQIATVYAWGAGTSSNFIALAWPSGGSRFGNQEYPAAGQSISASCSLIIDTNLPDTEDPNERFQERLFGLYSNSLPRVPAMNDVAWIPGVARLMDFAGPVGTELYGDLDEPDYCETNAVGLMGFGGHREMPVDAWALSGTSLNSVRNQLNALLTNYARRFTVSNDPCLYWTKPLAGAWVTNYGGSNATTLHNSEGWFTARVLVELYRYDLARGTTDTSYLTNIDSLFNWAKHFVWTRGEIDDVPSSPFAISATLSAAFLLDYHFTFMNDPLRSNNAAQALDLAQKLLWRSLSVWAMDSDNWDGALDSAFLAEPNSGRDWACLGSANEVNWILDTLAQVYVHTGDERLRFYLRGMLQRWPSLYRGDFEPSLADFSDFNDSETEGYGLVIGSGPGRGNRYDYGFTESLALIEPVSNSIVRVVAGDAACIAFDKGPTATDITNYSSGGNGACSFTIVSSSPASFDLSFSYPFVNIHTNTVTRNGLVLSSNLVYRPLQAPSSLYISGVMNGDTIAIGPSVSNAPPFSPDDSLVYAESAVQPITNGSFVTLSLAGDCLLPQDWTDFQSFAGIVPGLHWNFGVPYQQRLYAAANVTSLQAPQSYAVFVAYSPPAVAASAQEPALILDTPVSNSTSLPLSGAPVLAWRAWPAMFNRMILLDFALVPSGHNVVGVNPQGALVMGVTACTNNSTSWQWVQPVLSNAAPDFVQQQKNWLAQAALQNFFAQLPPGRAALLPSGPGTHDYRGPALDFAGTNGLACQWTPLSLSQCADTNSFNATLFPLAFYMGDDWYVATVNTTNDARSALLGYLRGGGTLLVMSVSPSPMFYAGVDGQDSGPEDGGNGVTNGLLCYLGLPWVYYDAAPSGSLFQVQTNQVTMPNVARSFPFPPPITRDFGLINPAQVNPADHYVPWISMSCGNSPVGDAAGCIEFHQGPAANGRIIYISNALLLSSQATAIMADAASWLCADIAGISPPLLDTIQLNPAAVVLGFKAQPNLDYSLESCDDLLIGSWSSLADIPGAPTNTSMTVTDPRQKPPSRFYRLLVHP